MAVPQPAGTPDLRDHLGILWRRKWAILLVVVVAVGAALAYSLTRTPLYRASAEVLISGTPTATGAIEAPRSVSADINVASGSAVAEAARADVGREPRLSVSGDNTAATLTFTAVSAEPERAAAAADAYAAAFVAERQRLQIQEYDNSSGVLQQQINDIDAEIAALNDEEGAALLGEPDEFARAAISADFAERRTALDDRRSRYTDLLDSLTINAGLAQGGGARVVDPAQVPSDPFSPDTVRNVGLAAIVGLVAGIGLAYLLQYMDTRLRTDQDLEDVTGLATLTVVPSYADGGALGKRRSSDSTGSAVITLVRPRSEVSEAYRRLRTSIQFMGIDRPLKAVQVTSPTIGDGKTTTASNLAVTAARAGQRVVLVDCDLRRPRQHEAFGLSNDVGVTSVLTEQVPLAKAVHRLPDLPKLVILPTGPIPPDPAEMLGSTRMAQLIQALRDSADLIILDTPPVLAVSDPLVVSGLADGVLLVASAGRTDRRQVLRSLGQLRQVDAPLIGTVLNRFEPQRLGGYGYSYGYGYGYGPATGGGGYTSEAPKESGMPTNGAAGGAAHADNGAPARAKRSRLIRR